MIGLAIGADGAGETVEINVNGGATVEATEVDAEPLTDESVGDVWTGRE